MHLRMAPEITVEPAAAEHAADQDVPPRCSLRVRGQSFGSPLPGALLEAAVAVDDGYLLFLTDDVPFEDQLSIHWIGAGGELLDSAAIGAAYSTGSFAQLVLEPPDTVRFGFIGHLDWWVKLLPEKALRPLFRADAPGVSRRVGLYRHFIVNCRPRSGADGG